MPVKLPLKERVLTAAGELFYAHGIRGISVEEIAKYANTTKAGIYRNFDSKDHLVAKWLSERDAEHKAWWLSIYKQYPNDPIRQLHEIMSGVGKALLHSTRGCPFTNSSVELTTDEHIARSVVLEHKAWIRHELNVLCQAAKIPSHHSLAETLFLLMEGAKISTNSFESKNPSKNLAQSAKKLINIYLKISN